MKVKELIELLRDHLEKEVLIYSGEYKDACPLEICDVYIARPCSFYLTKPNEVVLR